MTFPELVEKTGLELATEIYKEAEGQDFDGKMTFDDWQEVIKVISLTKSYTFREVP
jgi:hypothetical protein